MSDPATPPTPPPLTRPTRSVVLVGLMGAGKSAVGRRLAQRLGVPFLDADTEIENAAGCTVEEIFARDGEAAFRQAERKVIARLLTEHPVHVLATGGGAYMDEETRRVIRDNAISVWLRAELEILVQRTARRNHRPILKRGDPRTILERLIIERYPVYAQADITVESDDRPPDVTTELVARAVSEYVLPIA